MLSLRAKADRERFAGTKLEGDHVSKHVLEDALCHCVIRGSFSRLDRWPGAAGAAAVAEHDFLVASIGPGKGADLGGLEGADRHCQTLATAAGAGGKTWRAYLSSNAAMPGGAVSARDRIGRGPWQNFKGVVVAQNVDDLHSDNNKLGLENSLTERGTTVSGTGMTPNWHDVIRLACRKAGRSLPT